MDKPKLSPCKIIAGYEPAIVAVANGNTETVTVLRHFIRITQPQDCEPHLRQAKAIYLDVKRLKNEPTEFAESQIERLIQYLKSVYSSEYMQRPCTREMTDYGLIAAHNALSEGGYRTKAIRDNARKWLVQLVEHTPFEYHLIDPDRYYDHLLAIRVALPELIKIEHLESVLSNAPSVEHGLNQLEGEVGYEVRKNNEKFALSPHAKISPNLLKKYDTVQKLNSSLLRLGAHQREKTTRNSSPVERTAQAAEFTNTTLESISAVLRREGSEPVPIGKVATRKATHKAEKLLNSPPRELFNAVASLSNGDTSHPLTRLLNLQSYAGAEPHIIEKKLRQVHARSQHLNSPHPTQNAVFTLSELFDDWQAIQGSVQDKRLSGYLCLIMFTGLDESRARTLKEGDGPTDSNDATIYLNADDQLVYLLQGAEVSGHCDLCIKLSLSTWLAKRLRLLLRQYADGFSQIESAYAGAKKVLRKAGRELPRFLSQWMHGAREVLGQILCDFEIEVISGYITGRNRTASAYACLDIEKLNCRVFESYQTFLSRLSESATHQLSWLQQCLTAPRTLPTGHIGSIQPSKLTLASQHVESLYARQRTLKKEVKHWAALGRIDVPTIVKELNTLCINYWMMTQWITTGRGNMQRLSITLSASFLVVEDKDSSEFRLPRICAHTDQPYSYIDHWSNQYEIILNGIRHLSARLPEPIAGFEAFYLARPYIPLVVVTDTSSGLPRYKVESLSRAKLDRLVIDLELPNLEFPSNLPRHLWMSAQIGLLPTGIVRQQLGHQTYGVDMLSRSSSASVGELTQEMKALEAIFEATGLKTQTFGALPYLAKEVTSC